MMYVENRTARTTTHDLVATSPPVAPAIAADAPRRSMAIDSTMALTTGWQHVAYTYDGVYLAATRTRIMRNTMIGAFTVFLVLIYTLLPLIGNAGLWIAVAGFLTGRGLLLRRRVARGFARRARGCVGHVARRRRSRA